MLGVNLRRIQSEKNHATDLLPNASSKGQPNYHNITRIAFAGVRGMRTSVGAFQTSASDDTERQDAVTVAEQPHRRGQRQVDGGGARIRSDG